MFASAAFTSRPFSSGQIPARQTLLAATAGEYGWSAWTYSKTAKLNAWAWHGLGITGTANINAWSQLGNSVYLRRDGDQSLYLMQPDVYFLASETNSESQAVYAETQWLDFGKPGDLKALTGIDFDGLNVVRVEVYVSVDGGPIGHAGRHDSGRRLARRLDLQRRDPASQCCVNGIPAAIRGRSEP